MRIRLLLLGLGVLLLAGCHVPDRPADAPQPPLATSGTVAPPAGCVALRERGGSC